MKREIALLFGVPLVLLALYDCSSVAICDGFYQLTVEIESEAREDATSIHYIGYHGSEIGDALQANIDANLFEMHQPEELADSFQTSVMTTVHRSPLGRSWGDVQQFSDMIVVLHREDGTRSVHRLNIPHRDITRRVVVSKENQVPEQ